MRRAAVRSLTAATLIAAAVATAQLTAQHQAGARPPAPPGVKASRTALAQLSVASKASLAGYSRARFGDGWAPEGDSCNTRDRVLQRDGHGVHTTRGCQITGTWTSPYDGAKITVAHKLDIDHVVPLAEAWRTGARAWTPARREAFANDLKDPELVAVSAHTNRAKGDSSPDEWKPPRHAAWCLYARWWIAVKSTWRMTVTGPERMALRAMLRRC